MTEKYDFCGWLTKYDTKCADGRIIKPRAFAHQNGSVVPLVWHHSHNTPENVLGKLFIEEKNDGVYACGEFNNTPAALAAKEAVVHGDVTRLSVYANELVETDLIVKSGTIREGSLVLAGANPGAVIDYVAHDGLDDSAIIYSDESIEVYVEESDKELKHAKSEDEEEEKTETVKDVYDSLNEKQKTVVHAMLAQAADLAKEEEDKKEKKVEHSNVFDNGNVIQHDGVAAKNETFAAVLKDAQVLGSLRSAALKHDFGSPTTITSDPQPNVVDTLNFYKPKRWYDEILGRVKHVPFNKIVSLALTTVDDPEVPAFGYNTGSKKNVGDVYPSRRETYPTTIYAMQKIDRDLLLDITSFDVIKWMKDELTENLNSLLAQSILLPDEFVSATVDSTKIRPIVTDAGFVQEVTSEHTNMTHNTDALFDAPEHLIEGFIRARYLARFVSKPVAYISSEFLANLLTRRRSDGERFYHNINEVAADLRADVVEVDVLNRRVPDSVAQKQFVYPIVMADMSQYQLAIVKNSDAFFSDFDIDYNKHTYLVEKRVAGALVKKRAALVAKFEVV